MDTKIEVVLGLVAVNVYNPPDTKFLIISEEIEKRLPTRELANDKSCLKTAAEMLYDITELEAKIEGNGWINLINTGIYDNPKRRDESGNRLISIAYAGMIPAEQQLKTEDLEWIYLSILFNSNLHKDHFSILKDMLIYV